MSNQDCEGPLCTVDVICYRFTEDALEVLLVQRKHEPFQHDWAIPGGFVEPDETIQDAAGRELQEETGITPHHLRQFRAYGGPDRDPRGPVVTICYVGCVRPGTGQAEAASDAEETGWHKLHELPSLAFDHDNIMSDATEQLTRRVQHTPDAFRLLPERFTLDDLYRIYRYILDPSVDRQELIRMFRDNNLIVPADAPRQNDADQTYYRLQRRRFTEHIRQRMPFSP